MTGTIIHPPCYMAVEFVLCLEVEMLLNITDISCCFPSRFRRYLLLPLVLYKPPCSHTEHSSVTLSGADLDEKRKQQVVSSRKNV